jgi:hypothetical protein
LWAAQILRFRATASLVQWEREYFVMNSSRRGRERASLGLVGAIAEKSETYL